VPGTRLHFDRVVVLVGMEDTVIGGRGDGPSFLGYTKCSLRYSTIDYVGSFSIDMQHKDAQEKLLHDQGLVLLALGE
jgi:hypothetical protein